MIRELCYLILPLGVAVATTGCSTTPDIADYLKLQCEANPQTEIASQSVEMIPGQKIEIGDQSFDLTERGRLRYTGTNRDVTEIGSRNFVVIGTSSYAGQRFLVDLASEETGNKTKVEVLLNCQNPKEAN